MYLRNHFFWILEQKIETLVTWTRKTMDEMNL